MKSPAELVLGSLIMSRAAYSYMVQQGLDINMFGQHRPLAKIILDYREKNDTEMIPLPLSGLPTETNIALANLIDFKENESYLFYPDYYGALREEFWSARIDSFLETTNLSNPEGLLELSEKISGLGGGREVQWNLNNLITQTIETVEERNSPEWKNPYRTTFFDYDKLGHFEVGDLHMIAGKSGHGKSRLALNLAFGWLLNGRSVVYISYEMTDQACMVLMNCIHTQLPYEKVMIRKGEKLSLDQYMRYIEGFHVFKGKPLVINELAETVPQVRLLIRQHLPVDVFIVDTINELKDEGEQNWAKLGKLVSGYKRIAKEFRCLGIVLAQLKNIEGRPTKKEMLAEATCMKNTADSMDFLYLMQEENPLDCPDELKNIMEIYRVKGRFVGRGRGLLHFDGATGLIRDLSSNEKELAKLVLEATSGKRNGEKKASDFGKRYPERDKRGYRYSPSGTEGERPEELF